jgi:hypothetical protein
MTKKVIALLIVVCMLLTAPMALAKKPETTPLLKEEMPEDEGLPLKAAANGLTKGKGMAYHLYLFTKDSETWDITEGAWGKMTILATGKFVFNGHGLEPGVEYSLINYSPSTDWSVEPYPNPWPGEGSTVLAEGTADEGGNIHLNGNAPEVKGKVWLVPSSDFGEGKMIAWHPETYLFEFDLLPPLTIRHPLHEE